MRPLPRSLHANRRAVLIDSNIVRVLCRLVGAAYNGETRRKRWAPRNGHGADPAALASRVQLSVARPGRAGRHSLHLEERRMPHRQVVRNGAGSDRW